MLGDCYGPEFFKDIKNSKIRSALTQIAEETKEDLDYYQDVLKAFGCKVIRPYLNKNDSILNYIDTEGGIQSSQGVPRSPLHPRDTQLVMGNKLLYTGKDHSSIHQTLQKYNPESLKIEGPITETMYLGYKGDDAPDWPDYEDYVTSYVTNTPISHIDNIQEEFNRIHKMEKNTGITFPISAPSITMVGQDVYIDTKDDDVNLSSHSKKIYNLKVKHYVDNLQEHFPDLRFNLLNIGGHNDGCFHTLKPGAILSLHEIQRYQNTFPDWDILYFQHEGTLKGFHEIKQKNGGKWWVPGQEQNDEFTYFVETWLNDWVGYAEETVFDVNVLVLDENHVCVNNMNNKKAIDFFKKHNIEPIHVPWRHRFFWDGGLHCITLDLYREGSKKDYFPERQNPIIDLGFS